MASVKKGFAYAKIDASIKSWISTITSSGRPQEAGDLMPRESICGDGPGVGLGIRRHP
uniref:Uncharacterized protein n=1 Tax=Oryza sativa subsp. japonica TaxID=39947 RepID=Q6ZAG5_ORYSJ|nr:unknown protein [Oryza sativa Japonica Group]BAD09780.1 unknown protein [Oryza sativa Japonica Group]